MLRREYLDPRPLIGGDAATWNFPGCHMRFRPTPPHRGRLSKSSVPVCCLYLDPRPLIGGDGGSGSGAQHSHGNLDPRPLIGGDPDPGAELLDHIHLDPRPLIGGDDDKIDCIIKMLI